MKLGISYPVFDGEELLEYVLRPIRQEVHHISVVLQDMSYFGNLTLQTTIDTILRLHHLKLIDEIYFYDQFKDLSCKENETNIRNIGVDLSAEAGCTHHISSDIDEFYVPEQLIFAKQQMEGYDSSIVNLVNYFKRPTWKIVPEQRHKVSFIHPVETKYDKDVKFPFKIDASRKLNKFEKCRVFNSDEVLMHHMTYVRRDICKKLDNSSYKSTIRINEFIESFDRYQLGDKLCIAPEKVNRKTVLVPNIFNIEESAWEQHQPQGRVKEIQTKLQQLS